MLSTSVGSGEGNGLELHWMARGRNACEMSWLIRASGTSTDEAYAFVVLGSHKWAVFGRETVSTKPVGEGLVSEHNQESRRRL